jgi:hypothetical protein
MAAVSHRSALLTNHTKQANITQPHSNYGLLRYYATNRAAASHRPAWISLNSLARSAGSERHRLYKQHQQQGTASAAGNSSSSREQQQQQQQQQNSIISSRERHQQQQGTTSVFVRVNSMHRLVAPVARAVRAYSSTSLAFASAEPGMKIRAAVARGPKLPFTINELYLEEPQAGEVLVQVVACGICHTDLVSCMTGSLVCGVRCCTVLSLVLHDDLPPRESRLSCCGLSGRA